VGKSQEDGHTQTQRRRRIALAASVVLGLAGALVLWQTLSRDQQRPPAPAAAPIEATPDPTVAVGPPKKKERQDKKGRNKKRNASNNEPSVSLPPGRSFATGRSIGRVIVPAIGVNAPMIKLALNPDDSIKVPADTEKTGWWSGGAKPGRKGAAVIVGHVDSQSGPAVFHDLGRLASGDKVRVIHKDGPRATFVVTRRERVPKNRFPTDKVYNDIPRPTIRLITCGGEFDDRSGHYRDNVIVYGRKL